MTGLGSADVEAVIVRILPFNSERRFAKEPPPELRLIGRSIATDHEELVFAYYHVHFTSEIVGCDRLFDGCAKRVKEPLSIFGRLYDVRRSHVDFPNYVERVDVAPFTSSETHVQFLHCEEITDGTSVVILPYRNVLFRDSAKAAEPV
jgi:hypothetical protein